MKEEVFAKNLLKMLQHEDTKRIFGESIVIYKFDINKLKEKILKDSEDLVKAGLSFGLYPLFQYHNPIYKCWVEDCEGEEHILYITGEKAFVIEEINYYITKVTSYSFELGIPDGSKLHLPELDPVSSSPHIRLYYPKVFIEFTVNIGTIEWLKNFDTTYFINEKYDQKLVDLYKVIKIATYNKEFFKEVYRWP